MRSALGEWRVVSLLGEETFHVQDERIVATGWLPGQYVVHERRAVITGAPDFDGFCTSIDDPVVGNIVALKRAAFRDAIVAHRAWRQHFANEQRMGYGIVGRCTPAVDRRRDEEIGLEATLTIEGDLARPEPHLAQALSSNVVANQHRELERDTLMPAARPRRHEELAVDELVARGISVALLYETRDFFPGPTVPVRGWHDHNLLGGKVVAQLGMRHRTA